MIPDEQIERRLKPRVFVGPGFTIRFRVAEHAFEGVPITNLSENGCFATFPKEGAAGFTGGTVLEGLVLEHPQMPHGPMTGTIARVLDHLAGLEDLEFIGLGIHFLATPAETTEALQRFVTQQFTSHR